MITGRELRLNALLSAINANHTPSSNGEAREFVMQRTSIMILILAFGYALSSASPAAAGPGDPFNGIDVSISIVWSNGSSTTQALIGDSLQGTILMGIPDFGISSYSISVLADSGLAFSALDDTPPVGFQPISSATVNNGGSGTVLNGFNGYAIPTGPASIVVAIGTVTFNATGLGNFNITPFFAPGDGLLDNMIIDKSTGSALTAASVTVVPEPTAALLIAMGMGALSFYARRHCN